MRKKSKQLFQLQSYHLQFTSHFSNQTTNRVSLPPSKHSNHRINPSINSFWGINRPKIQDQGGKGILSIYLHARKAHAGKYKRRKNIKAKKKDTQTPTPPPIPFPPRSTRQNPALSLSTHQHRSKPIILPFSPKLTTQSRLRRLSPPGLLLLLQDLVIALCLHR